MNSFWWGSSGGARRGINWLSWDKLVVSKKDGGKGFHNLYAFNLSMLGKQGWRLMTNPNSLISRLLKVKYFSRGDFMGAHLGHNPRFPWRSIWTSTSILKQGCRWIISKGDKIRALQDLWLRDGPPFIPKATDVTISHDLLVADLITPGTKNWNNIMINDFVHADDKESIFRVPLLDSIKEDSIVWGPNKQGTYTVKSAYNLCINNLLNISHLTCAGDWNFLWRICIPPRVKTFIWQLCRGCVPVREKIHALGIQCLLTYVFCGGDMEHLFHLFIGCARSKELWIKKGFWEDMARCFQGPNNFAEGVWTLFKIVSKERVQLWCMLAWSLWKSRNTQLWEETRETYNQISMRAVNFFHQWQWARKNKSDTGVAVQHFVAPTRWKCPPHGFYKCNIDASFNVQNNIGIGLCLRNEEGQFVKVRTLRFSPQLQVHEGEALGLLFAIHGMRELGLNNIVYELDAKFVVDNFNNPKEDVA